MHRHAFSMQNCWKSTSQVDEVLGPAGGLSRRKMYVHDIATTSQGQFGFSRYILIFGIDGHRVMFADSCPFVDVFLLTAGTCEK